jgi:hypothetical protein
MSISAFLSTKTFEPHQMFSDQEMVLNQPTVLRRHNRL